MIKELEVQRGVTNMELGPRRSPQDMVERIFLSLFKQKPQWQEINCKKEKGCGVDET